MAGFEVGVLLAAGVVLALLLACPRAWTGRGVGIVLLLGAFTVITALSASWSIAPAETVAEAGRTLVYLAIFGLAVAAGQLVPRGSRTVAGGLLLGCLLVCGWAVLSRVFPTQLADEVLGARLGEPFDYWNALGAMAAMALPPTLWLGSRRHASPLLTALAYPAMGIFGLTVILTQSRGALGVAIVVALIWLAFVPLRLRSIAVLGLPTLAMIPIASWALSRPAFTRALEPLSSREAVAGQFGWMTFALCAGLLVVGLAIELGHSRRTPSLRLRRLAGIAVAGAACLAALGSLGAVALSDRGLAGTVSDTVTNLTSEQPSTPAGAARLGSVSSSRAAYWNEAVEIFKERPLLGRGANSFGLARLRYREDGRAAQQAHGFAPQALADLGLVGLALVLALAASWLAAASRAAGLTPRRGPKPEWGDERAALVAVVLTAVVFGLHSAIDWTWFVPGPAIAGLVAAGFVSGRGPLGHGAATAQPGEADCAMRRPRDKLIGWWHSRRSDPSRAAVGIATLAVAVLCAWAVWQPERADRATDHAYELLDRGDFGGASEQVLRARELDPYSPSPLFATATVLAEAGRPKAAYQVLEQAVLEHPRDPETWLRLAGFELDRADLPGRALSTLQGATLVDPQSTRIPPLRQRAQATFDIPLPPAPSELAPVPASAE